MFKRKKPKYTQLTSVKEIKKKIREFILDSQVPNANEVALALGCVPISDELLEREEEESDLRVERIQFLIPLLYGYATMFSQAFIQEARNNAEEANETPAELAKVVDRITTETQQILEDAMSHFLIGAVSQLVDLEMVILNKRSK